LAHFIFKTNIIAYREDPKVPSCFSGMFGRFFTDVKSNEVFWKWRANNLCKAKKSFTADYPTWLLG